MGEIDVYFWIGLVIGIIWIFRRKIKRMRREMQDQIDELQEKYDMAREINTYINERKVF